MQATKTMTGSTAKENLNHPASLNRVYTIDEKNLERQHLLSRFLNFTLRAL
jgi:hypothetical protein